MMKTILLSLFSASITSSLSAQYIDYTSKPQPEHLEAALEIAETFFENFQAGKHRENADYIVNSLGASWEESKRISQRNDYMGKFEIISLDPPKGVYGQMDGYDLLEEAFLPGSDRYFRHTYIGYHGGSVLLYEFRFYVLKDSEVTLHYIGWSETNPFEYLSTPDMLLPLYQR